MMWRANGRAVQYMYYPGQVGRFGDDFDWINGDAIRFSPGQWHRVQTYIVMNTPGLADGRIRSWFDGMLTLERDNLSFREMDNFAIDTLYFSTFFGGSAAEWAPLRDEHIDFDDLVVSSAPINLAPR